MKGKSQKFTTTCKVDYTYIAQLKLQKTKKKVILHCTTLTFWRFIAEYYHMKFKMADIVRLTQYLVCTSRTLLRHTPRDESNNFRKFKIAVGSHFENSFITILSRGSSDFNEIWCAAG